MAIKHLIKLTRVGFVFAREGVLGALDTQEMPFTARLVVNCARLIERRNGDPANNRLSRAFIRLGPTYIKLGQFLATRKDLVGAPVAAELALLQDQVPALPVEEARKILQQAFNDQTSTLFTNLEPAVAAASIAQVHKVILDTPHGRTVKAVKLLRPEVILQSERDLKTFRWFAHKLERWIPATRRLRPQAVVETLAQSIRRELDLRFEAAALSEIGENTAKDQGFHVPRVDWERTTRTVLTMDWVDGIPLNDPAAIAKAGIDLPALGNQVVQSFLRQAMRDGFFHADMHPGNLFVQPDGTLVAVDFGITGRLGASEQRFFAEVIHGFIKRDYKRIAQVHFDAGYVPATENIDDFATALRAIGEPIQDRTAEEISMARLLTQLFEVTELFRMETRPELIMMQKTMVVVEGVARSLNPKFNMWHTAEPVATEWMHRHLGVSAQVRHVFEDIQHISRAMRQLPDVLEKADKVLSRCGFEEDAKAEQLRLLRSRERSLRFGAAALWAVALALAAIAFHVYGIIL